MSFRNIFGAVCSFAIGLMLWLFPRFFTGANEPWDGNQLLYLFELFCAGLVYSLIAEEKPGLAYLGAYLGQFVPGFTTFINCLIGGSCAGGANLFPLGAIFMLIFTFAAFLGAKAGFAARRFVKNTET